MPAHSGRRLAHRLAGPAPGGDDQSHAKAERRANSDGSPSPAPHDAYDDARGAEVAWLSRLCRALGSLPEHVLDLPAVAAVGCVHDPADGDTGALTVLRVPGLGANHPTLVRAHEGSAGGLFEGGDVPTAQQHGTAAGRDHHGCGALQLWCAERRAGRAEADEDGLRGTDGAERAGLDAWRLRPRVDARVTEVLLGEDWLEGPAEGVIADLLLMTHPDARADQLSPGRARPGTFDFRGRAGVPGRAAGDMRPADGERPGPAAVRGAVDVAASAEPAALRAGEAGALDGARRRQSMPVRATVARAEQDASPPGRNAEVWQGAAGDRDAVR